MVKDEYQLVFCTCPNNEVAIQLADEVIDSKLAACVNIIPGITSVYTWENKKETSEEVLLMIKTTASSYSTLEAVITAAHPYECPEVIAIPIQHGFKGYLQWISENVSANNLH